MAPQSAYMELANRASVISRWNGAVPLGTAPHGCSRTGTRTSQPTYSSTPEASNLAITGPRAALAFGSSSHEGWLRSAVCCEGVDILGITSLPRVMADDTASS